MSGEMRSSRERGFSLIELMVISGIVAVLVAFAIPNIRGFLRTYQLNGSARQVIAELQGARMRAVHSRSRPIFFVIVGPGQFRWVVDRARPDEVLGEDRLGPLHQLPGQVEFEPAAVPNSGASVRFNSLGGFCNPATGAVTCNDPVDAWCRAGERDCTTPGGQFIAPDGAVAGGLTITLVSRATGLRRTVFIAPGGGVRTQQ